MTLIITVKFSLAFVLLFSLVDFFFLHYLTCFLELICVLLSLIHVFLIYWEDKTLPLVSPVGVCGQISTLQTKKESLLFCVYGIISFLSLFVQVLVSIRASPFFSLSTFSSWEKVWLSAGIFHLSGAWDTLEGTQRKNDWGIKQTKQKIVIMSNEEGFCFSQRAPWGCFLQYHPFFSALESVYSGHGYSCCQ